MNESDEFSSREMKQLAGKVPEAVYEAAVSAYETARMDGLCHEGAWEIALGVVRGMGAKRGLV